MSVTITFTPGMIYCGCLTVFISTTFFIEQRISDLTNKLYGIVVGVMFPLPLSQQLYACNLRVTCPMNCHEKFGPGVKSVRPDQFWRPKGVRPDRITPKFVRLIQKWSGHINTSYTWRLVLVYVKMGSERGRCQKWEPSRRSI